MVKHMFKLIVYSTKQRTVYKTALAWEEKKYNPNAVDIENFVYFLSNFDNSKTIVKCDWEKKELTVDERFHTRKLHFCDPPFVQYYVDNENIIHKHEITDGSMNYPNERYNVNIIYVEW